jgi:hypothetical protein
MHPHPAGAEEALIWFCTFGYTKREKKAAKENSLG